jgi:exportin-7
MPGFVTAGLIQLVCRVTKLGWFSAPERGHEMRTLATDVDRLLQNTPAHCVVGLSILEQFLLEMNRPITGQTLTTHRKGAVSFRDHSMLHIFNCTLNVLKAVHGGQMNALPPQQSSNITELSLKVLINCLSFDFIGTNPDESAYEVGTIQIPKAWEAHFMPDRGTMPMLFELYMSDRIEPGQGMLVLESLVLYASARRSIFRDDAARGAFLHQLMSGIASILAAGSAGWKDDENCYHQLCRLLGKLKANYQLSELVRTEGYAKWVDLCFHFTKESFERLDRNANSSHYLLALWAKMVSATPYVKSASVLSALGGDASKVGAFANSKTMHGLDQYVPRIIGSFVEGRLNAIHMSAMSESVDTPLENPDVRQAQLQHMPHISRYYYADVARQITRFLDLSSITKLFTGPPPAPSPVKDVHEQQAGWLVYVVAALLDGQLAAMNLKKGTNDELTDAELCRRVLVLAHGADERMRTHGASGKCHRLLEMSFLTFFRAFHRAYIGEHRGMPAVDLPSSPGAKSLMGLIPPHASPAVAVRTSGPTEKQQMCVARRRAPACICVRRRGDRSLGSCAVRCCSRGLCSRSPSPNSISLVRSLPRSRSRSLTLSVRVAAHTLQVRAHV